MSRRFKLDIIESEAELRQRLHRETDAQQKEKLMMLWWVKSGQVTQQQELGQRLARDTSTISRWLQKYRNGGLADLLEQKKAPGAARKMSEGALAALQEKLTTSEGFSSYQAIVEWLKLEHGEEIKYGTVYQWVRQRWGAKLKVPRPSSYKQDSLTVEDFKKNSVRSLVV